MTSRSSNTKFWFKKASINASASLTDETTATPVSCDKRLIFQPSDNSFAYVGVLITKETNLSSIIVNEVCPKSSALPTITESIPLVSRNFPVPSVE